jgi:soluble P-type ATPase
LIAIVRGTNDAGMLRQAEVGVGVLSKEGLAIETLTAADAVTPDIPSALAMLENPLHLIESLRR